MISRCVSLTLVAAAFCLSLSTPAHAQDDDLVVHEWGYFIENTGRHALDQIRRMPSEIPSMRKWGDGQDGGGGSFTGRRGGSRVFLPRTGRIPNRGEGAEPYIYFYSEKARRVAVSVRCPGGMPLLWWPTAQRDREKLTWEKVRILPRTSKVEMHQWSKNERWDASRTRLIRARDVASSPIKVHNKHERYLFYEGTVDIDKLLVRRQTWEGLELRNASSRSLTHILVFRPGSYEPIHIERIAAGATKFISKEEKGQETFGFLELTEILTEAGLFEDEATVMAQSVFETDFVKTPGTKVLYLVDQDIYDRIHPLEITPKPKKIVRVGLVISLDVDNAITRLIGGSKLNSIARRNYTKQTQEILTKRIEQIQPLTASMFACLEKGTTRRMAALRRAIRKDFTKPEKRAAYIDKLIALCNDTSTNEATVKEARRILLDKMRRYLYAGYKPTSLMRDVLEELRPETTRNEALFVTPDQLQ